MTNHTWSSVARKPGAGVLLTAVLLTACAGCAGDPTGMIVEVHAKDSVRGEIEAVALQVWNGQASPVVDESFPLSGVKPADEPLLSLGLRPANPEKTTIVTIMATGKPGKNLVNPRPMVAEARAKFRRGEVQRVRLVLGADCGGVCPVDQICHYSDTCVPASGAGVDAGSFDGGAGAEAGATGEGAPPGTRPVTGDAGPDGPRNPAPDPGSPAPGGGGPTPMPPGGPAPSPPPMQPPSPPPMQPPAPGQMQPPSPPPMQPPAPPPMQPPAPPPMQPPAPPPMQPPAPPPMQPPTPPPMQPPKLALGEPCRGNGMCASNFCVDGLCCNSRCDGSCQSCVGGNTGGADGRCEPVASGRDPDDDCPIEAPSSCGNDGFCDGGGSCRQHPSGTSCGGGSCTGNDFSPGATCDDQGSCVPAAPRSCGLHRCAAAGCQNPCRDDNQCADQAYCDDGTCQARRRPGEACSEDRQCLLGICSPLLRACLAL
jgi:hypothetical protein